MGDVVQWGWVTVEFLVEKFEGVGIWAQKIEVLTHIGLGRPTPQGGLLAGPKRARGPVQPLDSPVMPKGLGPLRICMDDRYAGAGQGGEEVAGNENHSHGHLSKSHAAPQT